MDIEAISKALLYAAAHYQEQPSLEKLAGQAGLSPAYFQRSFQRLVGVSPKSFVQHLTARQAAASLRSGSSVLAASLDSGLSGPGRLHDLIVQVEGATPGEVANGGEGLILEAGLVETPWGRLYAAKAPRGLAFAAFAETAAAAQAKSELRRLWPQAQIISRQAALEKMLQPLLRRKGQLHCWIPGTPFQLQVWRALLRVPLGAQISYQGLAHAAGLRGARAVGGAVAANPLALAIPCHRVVRASGAVGEYHWGPARKRGLLAWEAALSSPEPEAA